MLPAIVIPPVQPARKVLGYKMAEDNDHLLPWEFVAGQMAQSRHYWLNTINKAGHPHTVPVWGIWYHNRLHFEGSPQTAWARHLSRDPHIAVHLPSAEQVVIIEGTAHIIADDEIDSREWERLDRQFQTKYQVEQGSPYWYVQPQKVLAWDGESLETMTRWVFA